MTTAMSNLFKRATKRAAKLRLAMIGPPGSGKTYSALLFAVALMELVEDQQKKIAFIDTEKGSASKYADLFNFDVMEMEGSFHPKRYVDSIHIAEKAGYGVLIIDSLSHAWIGTDGGLDLHDQAVARQKTKNSFTAWADVTPHHNELVQALVQCKAHLIVTMRSKVEYVQEKDDRTGRTTVRKVGTAPMMRDGLEYEFDIAGDVDTDHNLVITKSRCPAVADKVFNKPGRDFIGNVIQWLGGEPAPVNGTNGNGQQGSPQKLAAQQQSQPSQQPATNGTNGHTGHGKPPIPSPEKLADGIAKLAADWERRGHCRAQWAIDKHLQWGRDQGCDKPFLEWPETLRGTVRKFSLDLQEWLKQTAPQSMLDVIDELNGKLGWSSGIARDKWAEVGLHTQAGEIPTEHRAAEIIVYMESVLRDREASAPATDQDSDSVPAGIAPNDDDMIPF